jgi:Type II secretion system (T2SS), protein E, N-terminal domain
MGTMKDIADNVRGSLIPQLYVLRRVPMRYRRILPLTVMKRFQCIVVGSAPGVLTVAITDRQNTSVIESLRRFTGQAIFPVLIDPTRMRLLIQRIERYEQSRGVFCSRVGSDTRKVGYYQFSMLRIQVGSIVMLLSCQKKRLL